MYVSIDGAWETVRELARKSTLTEQEEFIMNENLQFLLDTTGDSEYAVWIGGNYYEKRDFRLARKYYELAESMGNDWVSVGLGYIWYYGRTGTVDYEKAFHYFSKTLELKETGDANRDADIRRWKEEAAFKIADMYKNGYYVEKNYDKYVSMIEDLYQTVGDEWYGSRAEVYTRLASIRVKQGKTEEAIELYLTARKDLVKRLWHNRFFGDLNRINWLVNDLYKLIEFDMTEFDLYDLYYLLNDEHTVRFEYKRTAHEIESKKTEEGMLIRFDGKWYKDISDFFRKADLENESIEKCYYGIENMEVIG